MRTRRSFFRKVPLEKAGGRRTRLMGHRVRVMVLGGLLAAAAMLMAAPAAGAISFFGPANFPAGDGPISVAVDDFNHDSKRDIVVVDNPLYCCGNRGLTVSILLGSGSGSFTGPTQFDIEGDPPGPLSPQSVAIGDFNSDSNPDLAVPRGGLGTFGNPLDDVSILFGNGDGTFTEGPTKFRAGADPAGIAAGDFNGDTLLDLAVVNTFPECRTPCGFPPEPLPDQPAGVSILLGTGTGGFSAPANFAAGEFPVSAAIGDLNGDSELDLAVVNRDSDNVSILLGSGAGTFTGPTNFAAGDSPWSVAVGEFNGDSKQDLAVGNSTPGGASILLGNGDGTFQAPTDVAAGGGSAVAVADLDGDSKSDLAVGNQGPDTVSVLLGNGDGSFTPPASFPAGADPNSVAVDDFDGDSKPDLAVANVLSDNVSVLLATAADLSLTKTGAPTSLPVGGLLTYTLRVTNNGPAAASGVSLTDVLPKSVRLRSVRSDHGRCAQRMPRRIECNLADLANGETATVTIVVRPTKKGTIVNTATADASRPLDLNPANNTATATTEVTP